MVNDFGYWLDIDQTSPNAMAPGKRMEDPMGPVHVLRDGRLTLAIGTPGSFGIPQTIAQMVLNVLDFGLNVQAAIEAPRLRLAGEPGRGIQVESRFDPAVIAALTERGHQVEVIGAHDILVGGGHGMAIDPATGLMTGGADIRRDGAAFGLA
jgi:gamma-glutamyltranspeptidase/glutathione hydrolase